jgi:chorismate-pyruvate lyase
MPDHAASAPAAQSSASSGLAHPLDEFYKLTGQSLPPLVAVDGEAVPEPYKRLLVHQNDMTPTLENFYQGRLHLQVLGRRRKEDSYFREVILLLDGTNQPVEFGAIKINLALFPPAAREQILKEELPLGHILQECKILHTSRPRAFLRLASDRLISEVLKLSGAQMLYGRRNTLFDPQGCPLAEIVEILPVAGKKDGAA